MSTEEKICRKYVSREYVEECANVLKRFRKKFVAAINLCKSVKREEPETDVKACAELLLETELGFEELVGDEIDKLVAAMLRDYYAELLNRIRVVKKI